MLYWTPPLVGPAVGFRLVAARARAAAVITIRVEPDDDIGAAHSR